MLEIGGVNMNEEKLLESIGNIIEEKVEKSIAKVMKDEVEDVVEKVVNKTKMKYKMMDEKIKENTDRLNKCIGKIDEHEYRLSRLEKKVILSEK